MTDSKETTLDAIKTQFDKMNEILQSISDGVQKNNKSEDNQYTVKKWLNVCQSATIIGLAVCISVVSVMRSRH